MIRGKIRQFLWLRSAPLQSLPPHSS